MNYILKELKLIEKKKNLLLKKKNLFFNRNILLNSFLLNKILKLHNGKNFINFNMAEKYIGFKFGSFLKTRKWGKKDWAKKKKKGK